MVQAIDQVDSSIKKHIDDTFGRNINLYKIEELLDALVKAGDFSILQKEIEILSALGTIVSQLIQYYKIVNDFFCNKILTEYDLEQFFHISDGTYDEKLFKFLIANNEQILLKKYENKIPTYLQILAKPIIEDNMWGTLIFKNEEAMKLQEKAKIDHRYNQLIFSEVFSYLFVSRTPLFCFQVFGNIENPNFIQSLQMLYLKIEYFDFGNMVATYDREVEYNKLIANLKSYKEKIATLDIEYRAGFAYILLLSSMDNDTFLQCYKDLDNDVKNKPSIAELNYIFQIRTGKAIDLIELYEFAFKNSSDKLLYIYFQSLRNKEIDIIDILNKNIMILHFSIGVFILYFNELLKTNDYQKCKDVLVAFKEYEDSVEYMCLKGEIQFIDKATDLSKTIDEVNKRMHNGQITNLSIFTFIDFATIIQRLDIIYCFEWENVFIEIKLYLLDKIINKNYTKENTEFIERICTMIIDEGYEFQKVYYYRGISRINLGKSIDAISDLSKSFQLTKNVNTAIALLKCKCSLGDFSICDELKFCQTYNHYEAQQLAGVFSMKNKENDNAYKYFLRSLLIHPKNNQSLNAIFQLGVENHIENNETERIQKNSFVKLKPTDSDNLITICIHEKSLKLPNMVLQDFAECKHFFEDDSAVESLLLKKVGESVGFLGDSCIVIEIMNSKIAFTRYAMSQLIKNGEAQTFSGSPETLLKQISDLTKTSSEITEKQLQYYAKNQGLIPVSFLSTVFGKSLIESYEFLIFGNKNKIINNSKTYSEMPKKIVLSFDAIILINALGINLTDIKSDIIIPYLVYSLMKTEIAQLKDDAENYNKPGYAAMIEGAFKWVEFSDEQRRARIRKLNELERFIDSFQVAENAFDINEDSDIKKALLKMDCNVDFDTIGLAKECNATILTDNAFLYEFGNRHKVNALGLTSFLTLLYKDNKCYCDSIIKLAQFNFANYIDINVANRFTESIAATDIIDEKTAETQCFFDLLINDYKDKSLDKYNHELIIQFYRKIRCEGIAIDSCLYGYLERIAVYFYKIENPERIKEMLEKMSFAIVPTEDGNFEIRIENKEKKDND
jgi:hypothetical protein